jgi:hypothetical protein
MARCPHALQNGPCSAEPQLRQLAVRVVTVIALAREDQVLVRI